MKKKFLSVATASVLAVSMLAGCGGGDNGNASSSTPPAVMLVPQHSPAHPLIPAAPLLMPAAICSPH